MDFIYISVDWYNATFIFYLSLIFGMYYIAVFTKNINIIVFNGKRYELWIILIPAILFFIKGFSTTGRDLRAGYYYNFIHATSLSEFPDYTVETGYRLLNVIIRNLTDQYWIFIAIISVLSLFPIVRMLKKYSHAIDLPIAVLMYGSIFFISSFSPLRMCLAASIGLFAFDAIVENKSLKAFVWIIIASFFHTSSLILFIPFLFTQIKGNNIKIIVVCLLMAFLVTYFGRSGITSLLAADDRYYIYQAFDSVNIGFEQFIYFIPIIYSILSARKYVTDKHFLLISFAFVATAFCVGLMGYVISIFGRFRDMFLPLIIIVPYYVKIIKMNKPNHKLLINIIVAIYCLSRFYIYISQYYKTEDLMPYTNIFGWLI